MRLTRGWRNRTWALVWAVLQFALPAAATTADAHVERESRLQVVHVEADSTSGCRPVHAAECALCQLITHDAGAPADAPLPVITAAVACPVDAERVSPAAEIRGGLPPPRAPPPPWAPWSREGSPAASRLALAPAAHP